MSLRTTQFAHSHNSIVKQSMASGVMLDAELLAGNIAEQEREKAYLTQALSHDINAYLMILEFSFRHYDQLVQNAISTETSDIPSGYSVTNDDIWKSDDRIIIAHGAESVTGTPHAEKTARSGGKCNKTVQYQQQKNIEQLSEVGGHIRACISQMRQFISDLVTLVKTGNIDMQSAPVSLDETVNEVIFEQRQLMTERKIDVRISRGLQRVYVNKTRLKQLVTNLIRNAAIHGCDSTMPMIRVSSIVNPKNKLSDKKMVSFSISDNGRGISVQDRTHIFDPGYRGIGNQNEGSGIGLALVKKIAQYYKGDVILKATRTGTTFIVTLPQGTDH